MRPAAEGAVEGEGARVVRGRRDGPRDRGGRVRQPDVLLGRVDLAGRPVGRDPLAAPRAQHVHAPGGRGDGRRRQHGQGDVGVGLPGRVLAARSGNRQLDVGRELPRWSLVWARAGWWATHVAMRTVTTGPLGLGQPTIRGDPTTRDSRVNNMELYEKPW